MTQGRRRRRGSGSIIKRGNIYWLYHTRYGKLQGESLGTSSKQEADQKARQRLQEIDDEIIRRKISENTAPIIIHPLPTAPYQYNPADFAESSGRNIQEFIKALESQYNAFQAQRVFSKNPVLDDIWKLADTVDEDLGLYITWFQNANRSMATLENYRGTYKKFRHYFRHITNMGDVTEDVAKKFEAVYLEKGVSQNAVNQYFLAMQSIWSTAIKEGWYDGINPFHPKRNNAKRQKLVEFLSKEQVRDILAAADSFEDKSTFLFIAIAVHTGMRKSEVLHMRWEDIDFDNRIVKVQRKKANPAKGIQAFLPKSKQARSIPLKSELKKILEPYISESGYIIKPDADINRSKWNLAKIGEITELTGIKFTPHLLRHTFASHASIEGISIYKIQRWLGHSNVQITADVYAHLNSSDDDIDRF